MKIEEEYDSLIKIIGKLDYDITERQLPVLNNLLKEMNLFDYKDNDKGFLVYKHDEQLEAFLDWYFSFII